MHYVAHHAALLRPASDGRPERAHVAFAAKRGSLSARERLAGPRFPDSLAYLHAWFSDLNATRDAGSGFGGMAPITFQQIDAWARLTDERPAPHEVHALLTIDRAFRAAIQPPDPAQPSERSNQSNTSKPSSRRGGHRA